MAVCRALGHLAEEGGANGFARGAAFANSRATRDGRLPGVRPRQRREMAVCQAVGHEMAVCQAVGHEMAVCLAKGRGPPSRLLCPTITEHYARSDVA